MDEIVGRQTSEVDAMGQEITDCIVSKYDTKNMCAIQDRKMTDLGQTIHEVLKDFRERLDRIEPELRQAFKMAEKIDHDETQTPTFDYVADIDKRFGGNTALALMLGAQRRFEVTGETHFTALTQRFVDLVVQRRSCAGLSLGPCSG